MHLYTYTLFVGLVYTFTCCCIYTLLHALLHLYYTITCCALFTFLNVYAPEFSHLCPLAPCWPRADLLTAWVQAHKAQRPGNKVLQLQLDEWVEAFEEEEARKERARTAAMAEDGWTVVVRGKVGLFAGCVCMGGA